MRKSESKAESKYDYSLTFNDLLQKADGDQDKVQRIHSLMEDITTSNRSPVKLTTPVHAEFFLDNTLYPGALGVAIAKFPRPMIIILRLPIIIRELLEYGVDPNYHMLDLANFSALQVATDKNLLAMVECLLVARANPNLSSRGTNVSASGITSALAVSTTRSYAITILLIQYGAKDHNYTYGGMSALGVAIQRDKWDRVPLLVTRAESDIPSLSNEHYEKLRAKLQNNPSLLPSNITLLPREYEDHEKHLEACQMGARMTLMFGYRFPEKVTVIILDYMRTDLQMQTEQKKKTSEGRLSSMPTFLSMGGSNKPPLAADDKEPAPSI